MYVMVYILIQNSDHILSHICDLRSQHTQKPCLFKPDFSNLLKARASKISKIMFKYYIIKIVVLQ